MNGDRIFLSRFYPFRTSLPEPFRHKRVQSEHSLSENNQPIDFYEFNKEKT